MAIVVVALLAVVFSAAFIFPLGQHEDYHMPEFSLQETLPSNFSGLFNLDFEYNSSTYFTVSIGNFSDPVSVLLETREPYVKFEYGTIDLYHETKIFINGVPAVHHRTINTGDTLRHIWDIWLQPNTDYTFKFFVFGEGECGRFTG